MIIQGSNAPLVIQFDASVATLPTLVVSMWCDQHSKKKPLKVWYLEDMTVSGDTAICPLTEQETANLPNYSDKMIVEVKGLDDGGNIVFWDEAEINVKERRDKVFKLTGM